MEWLLKVEKLSKCYGKSCRQCDAGARQATEDNICSHCQSVWALRDVSFELRDGEILGLIGESGAGKSTLIDMLLGEAFATAGEALFRPYYDGRKSMLSADEEEWHQLRNFDIGIVRQSPTRGLFPNVSAGGNVVERLLAAGSRNVGGMRGRAEGLLRRMELVDRLDRKAGTFSAGMQQRVQIAKALANNPRMLLLDEPTTGLDVCVQARTIDLLRQVHRELGISMILITHDWNVLKLLATRAVVLKNGRVVERGLVEQIFEDPRHPYTQLLIHSSL